MNIYLWTMLVANFIGIIGNTVYLCKNKYPRVSQKTPTDDAMELILGICLAAWGAKLLGVL